MLTVWLVRYLLQLGYIRIFNTNCIQNNSLSLQILGVGLHVVLRFAICDHHSDLRHILGRPASRGLHKVMFQHEVQAFPRMSAASHVRKCLDVFQDVVLAVVGVEQELGAYIAAVLDQPDANTIRPDVKAVNQRLQKLTDLVEVQAANAPRPVHQEDDVSYCLLSAD